MIDSIIEKLEKIKDERITAATIAKENTEVYLSFMGTDQAGNPTKKIEETTVTITVKYLTETAYD